jgi:hypothetical protein
VCEVLGAGWVVPSYAVTCGWPQTVMQCDPTVPRQGKTENGVFFNEIIHL